MRDILFRVQKYIQIEDATWSADNRSPKKGSEGEAEATTCCTKKEPESGFQHHQNKKPHQNQAKANGEEEEFPIQNLRRSRLQRHRGPTFYEAPDVAPA